MLDWYETREEVNLRHRDQNIPSKKKILLTEEQAKLHNTHREQVVKSTAPVEESEVAVLAEYEEWKASQVVEVAVKSPKSEVKK